ncbi:YqgE/AlgH family protein [Psychroflexus maritimus]|uniref:YqgE/AlgH family protein n=1 Tax=Psychroflexus maritimus TaxID=2714865 RepID=A0A967AEA9_9FLAO|nr:YqgE/AlgH family protein [Psychroflexus maritimus]NGZ90707.1 YqgE/AlgH family protein [Psychroflexus maritimus]
MKVNVPKQGVLLIAEPSIIGDLSFNRSVILLSHHSKTGSVGFILNKLLSVTLNELVPEIKVNFKIFNGGPVEQDNLYFIHKVPELIPNSIRIEEGIFWGGSFEKIITLINEEEINEADIKFFLGYSGWDAQQLEDELEKDTWVINTDFNVKEVISSPDANYWKSEIKKLGGEYLIWSNAPENPNLN